MEKLAQAQLEDMILKVKKSMLKYCESFSKSLVSNLSVPPQLTGSEASTGEHNNNLSPEGSKFFKCWWNVFQFFFSK